MVYGLARSHCMNVLHAILRPVHRGVCVGCLPKPIRINYSLYSISPEYSCVCVCVCVSLCATVSRAHRGVCMGCLPHPLRVSYILLSISPDDSCVCVCVCVCLCVCV